MTQVQAVQQVEHLADHSLLLTVPAMAPALLVVGVVSYVARRDRRRNTPLHNDGVSSAGSTQPAGRRSDDGKPRKPT